MTGGAARRRRAHLHAAIAWGLAIALLAVPCPAVSDDVGDPSAAGAYCQLPEPGLKPRCLAPAQERYADFFKTLEEGGTVDPAAMRAVESDLAAGDDVSYLALSSLSYAYWRMALKAAETETVDPEIAERLEHWNLLLHSTYSEMTAAPEFQLAIRTAAADLQARTGRGDYRPADGLARQLDGLESAFGARGALRRLLDRIVPEDPAPEPAEGAPAE